MPDFSAISSLLGAIKNVLEGTTGLFGSLAGDGIEGMLGMLGSVEVVAPA